MDLGLTGLKAVVTGGTAGIGKAIVETLLAEGCHVATCSRRRDRVDALLAQTAGAAGKVMGTSVDVTDEAAFADWTDTVAERFGGIDIFIPNVSAMPDKGWDEMMATDIKAVVGGTETVLPHLQRSEHASVVYIGSKASTFGTPGIEAYGAAKAATTHYMKSLALRMAGDGIRVNVVSPGDTFVEGGWWDAVGKERPEVYRQALAGNPMGRFGRPEEAARLVCFLASPAASFVSGAHILSDGASTRHVHG